MVRAARIGDDLQDGNDVCDLRNGQQPGQPEHLIGHPRQVHGLHEWLELAAGSAQDRPRWPLGRRAVAFGSLQGLDDGRRLPLGVRQPRGADLSLHRHGRGGERFDLDPAHGLTAQGAGHGVGRCKDGVGVAPGRGQVAHGGRIRAAAGPGDGEQAGKREQLAGRGAAEPVDRLVGVTHGGDRVATRSVQSAEQLELGVGGVLELVQQDHPVAGPFDLPHGRNVLRNAGGETNEVAEVHDPGVLGGPPVGDHELRHDSAQLQHREDLGDVGMAALGLRDVKGQRLAEEVLLGEVGLHPVRLHQVFGAVGRQFDGAADQAGRRDVREAEVPLVGPDDPGHDLVGLGLADHPGIRFQADAHPVVPHEGVGIGVIGGDAGPSCPLRREPLVPVSTFRALREIEPRLRQDVQLAVDALGQLSGGLAGEGHAEDLVRGHEAVGHEPHHAVGHRGGLPGPGAGHHQPRFQRRADHRRLLLGGSVLVQQSGQVLRAVARRTDVRERVHACVHGLLHGGRRGFGAHRCHSVDCLPSL